MVLISISLHLFSNKKSDQKQIRHSFQVEATSSAILDTTVDTRVERLYTFFKKYDSPLASVSAEFVDQADANGIDYRIVPSIAGAESTFCKNYRPETYNCWGYGPHITFRDYRHGISRVTSTIAKGSAYRRFQEDKRVETLARVYNPSSPEEWTAKVKYFISEIGSD